MKNFIHRYITSIALVVIILTLCIIACEKAYAQDPLVGTWQTIDDKTKEARLIIEIYAKDGLYYGRVVKILNASQYKRCTACSGSKKNQLIVGMVILWNMQKDGDEYTGGKILNPYNGKVYSCRSWWNGNTLKVRGYLSLFYRTETWKRVK